MRTPLPALLILASLTAIAPVLADITMNPDPNTLWVEDFDPFESATDSRAGWFAFEPAEIGAEQVGSRVQFREISEYAGGSIQRFLPLGGVEYRYLQVRVTSVENPLHYFKAWLRLSGEGNPQLGRMATGINTVDLGGFAFLGTLSEMPLNLAVIGPSGKTPSGAVELDWVRLVKSPVGGLTMALEEAGEANQVAEIGDTIVFTYTAEKPGGAPVVVTCQAVDRAAPLYLSEQGDIRLTDDDADGVFTARVTIAPEATEFSARAGNVIATAEVDGEARNVCAPFAFSIQPAPWRAKQAAEGIAVGAELFAEDFLKSETRTWRAFSDGWAVSRPAEGVAETIGLRNSTYDRPRPEGHWIALPTDHADNAAITAGLRPLGGSGPIMLALRFADPENMYRLRISNATDLALERVCAGWEEVLAQTTLPQSIRRKADEAAPAVTFTVAGSLLLASVDGTPVLHAYDNTFTTGGAALGLNHLNGQFDTVALHAVTPAAASDEFPWAGVRVRIGLRERDRAFGRDAGTLSVPVTIENSSPRPVGPLTLSASLTRRTIYTDPAGELSVPEIAAGESTDVRLALDPRRFRADSYILRLRLSSGEQPVATDAVRLEIGKPIPEERMDVFYWGGANIARQVEDLAAAGITVMHEFGQRSPELLTLGTRLGMTYYTYPPGLSTAPAELKSSYENPHAPAVALRLDELDPAVREWALKTANSHARAWGPSPRVRFSLLNTEYEGHSYPNLSEAAEARYRERLGFARPEQATAPYMPAATSLQLFPDRIIPDDSELYRWYQFFYTQGGSLNWITSEQSREVNRVASRITTMHDPVLRGPQFHGRFDGVDLLNHWTYVERNPLDVAAFADEMVCLGQRSGFKQQISQMIQVIAYADRAMPGVGPDAPEYLRDAPFVAIPPDIITESMWLVMSRPVDMIAFHGLPTALETQEKEGYRYTNPNTLSALGRVSEALIEPYGPALRQIKQRRGPRVALLLSGANTVFGSIMEGGGTLSLHNPLTAARFGVDVLYDEDIKDGALDGYAVLAIPQCRFLLKSVRERIDAFQQAGGTVLLDADAQVSIPGAVTLPQVSATGAGGARLELVPGEVLELSTSPRAHLDAELRLAAEALREQLLPRLKQKPFVDSPTPYVVLDARASGELSYIFAINDRRTVGPYLGQFGAVLERGVPINAQIGLRDAPGALYDALERRQLSVSASEGGGCSTELQIEPGWGKLLIAAPEPMGRVDLTVSDRPSSGGPVDVKVQAKYASGRTVTGVVPLRFDLLSPDGAINDYSRFTATGPDGAWSASVPIADNEPPGEWVVRVTELIGGNTTLAGFSVEAAAPGQQVAQPAPTPAPKTVALWQFDRGKETAEARGAKFTMTLRGRSRFVTEGKSGGCVECFPCAEDKPEGVEIAKSSALSPSGAFSAELWLKPKPEMAQEGTTMLLDCNYYLQTREDPRANKGYAFLLRREGDVLRPTVILGLGSETVTHKGKPVTLEAGTWYRLGFAYDGAGRVTIFLNGEEIGGGKTADAGSIAPAVHPLIIGGRVGSSHSGCAGFIDEVRILGE